MPSLDDLAPGVLGLPIGLERRAARTTAVDDWLRSLAGPAVAMGACVVAVGGYGRGDLAPGSDLDVLLLVPDAAGAQVTSDAADALWYPVWDAGVRLDHSVRTVAQARVAAADDVRVMLGLLDARPVAGDRALLEGLSQQVWADWRTHSPQRLAQLRDYDEERHARHGELAHLIEPDLKESAGGLRDVVITRALAATSLGDAQWPGLREATAHLLDVRDALHTVTGRGSDVLVHQDQEAVAAALGRLDADDLLRSVFLSGRTIAHSSELTWRRVRQQSTRRRALPRWGRSARVDRTPLAEGVVLHEGEVALARGADPTTDPVLVLRVAAAAAQAGAVPSPHTAELLGASHAMPVPWPGEARDSLVALLGAGRAALPVWEALDQVDAWSTLIPEWAHVRSAPQHNPVHIYSVDRHLIETAVAAADLVRDVERPDLLLLAALLHDIGKGHPGDHSEVGAGLVVGIARRIGLDDADAHVLEALTRHHLLLPETATRRDPEDPATIEAVLAAVPDARFLRLLHALTVADARAAGPIAASTWRLNLIDSLVRRVEQHVAGVIADPEPDLAALATGGTDVDVTLDTSVQPALLRVTAPDFPGQLATVAGVLALHRVAVRTARTQTVRERAVSEWGITPFFGELPDPTRLAQDIRLAQAGALDVAGALAGREGGRASGAPPVARVVPRASQRATVLEVRAHDAPGLLHRIAQAITAAGCDVVAARVATMGAEALDVFYLVDRDSGRQLAPAAADAVADRVVLALTSNS